MSSESSDDDVPLFSYPGDSVAVKEEAEEADTAEARPVVKKDAQGNAKKASRRDSVSVKEERGRGGGASPSDGISKAAARRLEQLEELEDYDDAKALYKLLPSSSQAQFVGAAIEAGGGHDMDDASDGSFDSDVSEDDFMLNEPPAKKAAKAKASPKAKAKAKASPKAKAAPKKRSRDEDDFKDAKDAAKQRKTTSGKKEVVMVKDKKTGEMRQETMEEKLARKARIKLEEELPANRWWTTFDPEADDDTKWDTLEHNGVMFPPEYTPLPKSVHLLYDGHPVELTAEAEEIATFYARYIEADHVKKPVFRKNFFADFKAALNRGRRKNDPHPIKSLDKCDFSLIHSFLMEEREAKKNRPKALKDADKEANAKLQETYGFAVMDGVREKISNWKIEPPGLFLGRGDHPKAGVLKRRILPEEVTINIGKEAPVPPCPIKGANWKEVIHDRTVTWLATWREPVNNGTKYVFLAPSSSIKGKADIRKYETARMLKRHIGAIREAYKKEMKDKDMATRQRATAVYLIDRLALRVGNEKGEDEADTVGCCSLRVEHITMLEENQVQFDFLGKDSMRYCNTVTVPKLVYYNIGRFMKGKEPTDELFDKLSTSALNLYLKTIMPGLTAKVFRTYNASITLQQELDKMPEDMVERTVEEKVLFYNRCNREVAILCNHQRALPKTHSSTMERLDTKISVLEEEMAFHKKRLRAIEAGKTPPTALPEDNVAAAVVAKRKLSSDPRVIGNQIKRLKERIRKENINKTVKEENKNIAMGTSKINYMDPRITASWCKKVGEHVLFKIFSKSLRSKFQIGRAHV